MSNELIAKLNAALDEDERVAQEATSGPWSSDIPMAKDGVKAVAASCGDFEIWVADCRYEQMGPMAITNAKHIARHDPASVLRQVAATRKILTAYEEESAYLNANLRADGGVAHGLWTAIEAFAEAYGIEP